MSSNNNYNKSKIAEEYYQPIIDYCYSRLKDRDQAYETANKVIEIFLARWNQENNPNIKAWLIKTANNKISELRRELARKEKYEESYGEYEYIISAESEIEFDIDAKKRDELLDKININELHEYILDKLNKNVSELYRYLYIDRIDDDEVIEKFNLTKYAFMMRRTRLNKKVRIIVKEFMDDIRT